MSWAPGGVGDVGAGFADAVAFDQDFAGGDEAGVGYVEEVGGVEDDGWFEWGGLLGGRGGEGQEEQEGEGQLHGCVCSISCDGLRGVWRSG